MEHSRPGVTPPGQTAGDAPQRWDAHDVARAADGDVRAFERLYHGHVARIHGLARRMAGADDANELTQDVFVRAWEKIGTYRGEAAFGTWLYRLAINLIVARRSRRTLHQSRFLLEESILEAAPAKPSSHDLSLDFETAIESLPEGARQIFVLHDVEGYKHEEIAGMLGVTSGTSKAQLHRARMILRKALQR